MLTPPWTSSVTSPTTCGHSSSTACSPAWTTSYLRHTPPSVTTVAAKCVDHAYLRCLRDLEIDPTGAFFTDPLLIRRFRLR
eukprot:1426338-Prymnesium_polylepis.1